jgi:hypothetical protein
LIFVNRGSSAHAIQQPFPQVGFAGKHADMAFDQAALRVD